MAFRLSESTQFWMKFFNDAGIPTAEARNHAVSFTRHRIQVEMLPDLNKEYLNDMGITMMGDIIAILKHAKNVAQQTSREEALKALTMDRPRTPPRRSTAASRTVAHYLPKDDNAGPMNEPMNTPPKISQELASRLGPINELKPKATTIVTRTASPVMASRLSSNKLKQTKTSSPLMIRLDSKKQKEVVPVPKVRRVLPEHEGKYKVKMPAGTTEKTRKILEKQLQSELEASVSKTSSVFDRLGQSDSPEPSTRGFKVTGLDKVVFHKDAGGAQDSSVFGRLGGSVLKRPATSTVPDSSDTDDDGEGLEYHGVLKQSPVKKKKIMPTNIKKTIVRVEPPKKDGGKPSTEGIFSPFSAHSKRSVTARLGNASTEAVVAEAQTTTPKLSLKTSANIKKKVVNTRLGPQANKKSTTGKGVFSRLGKQL